MNSLHGEQQLRQRTLEASSNTYDKQLLSRIGGPNASKRQSTSYSSSNGAQESAQLAPIDVERRGEQLRPLAMPDERRPNLLDSPASSLWPGSAAVSPGFTGQSFWSEHGPPEASLSRSHTRNGALSVDEGSNHAQRGSYDPPVFNEDFMEDGRMGSLHLHDRSPGGSEDYRLMHSRAGTKRRASSPPREMPRDDRLSISSASAQSDVGFRRSVHQLPSREAPSSRFHPNHSSLSSASSLGPRHGSLGSSLGIPSIPSSATSYGSGRLSPCGLSPAMESECRSELPQSMGPSSHHTPVALGPHHHRDYSSASNGVPPSSQSESTSHSRNSSVSQMPGFPYVCECCPKKPKKFDTREELRYACSPLSYHKGTFPTNLTADSTSPRSSTPAHIVPTASRTRTRQSATKIRCICVAIRGPAPPSLAWRPLSMPRQPPTPTSAATVVMSSPIRRSGTCVRSISTMCTNLASATRPRNSSVPITFGSISSTVTPALAANGPICSRMHA